MGLPFIRRAASKLAVRIYFFGLVQFLTVILAVIILMIFDQRAPFPFASTLRFIASTIAQTRGDRGALQDVVDRLQYSMSCSAAVYDENDRLVVHDPRSDAPLDRSALRALPAYLTTTIVMPGAKTWHLVFLAPPPPPSLPTFSVLLIGAVIVGVASLLMARSLVRPLARLATAAHEFGTGNVEARVRVKRSDELGQVAIAFDQMADRVTHALRVEKELLANVSHELRTPLQRIHIAVELAAEGDADTARESLREIAEDLGELERIVEDVLTATRLSLADSGGRLAPSNASPPMRLESVDLRALLEKSAARFRGAHPARPFPVTIPPDAPPSLRADGVLLRRVIDNLLDNAHKYSEQSHTEVSLTARWSSTVITIEVGDRGPGIAPEDLKRVFEPFFRADRSRTRTTGGLGLGLALARRIVEAHGGTLTIDSVVGAGTVGRIELPLA